MFNLIVNSFVRFNKKSKNCKSNWLLLGSMLGLLTVNSSMTLAATFAEREEVQVFIKEISSKHNLNYHKLNSAFDKFESSPDIIGKMSKQFEELPWHRYRKALLTPKRIQDGKEFWQKHAKVIKKAEQEFGVPGEIIVAIIGLETFYGKNTGSYPVLQALSTLAFDYPRRAKFFTQELEQFVLLTQEEGLPISEIKGSFAGAMGTPQFIPSSYRKFAVDFAKTGKRDLINNVPDAIGSVANYLKQHGWNKNYGIAFPAKIKGEKFTSLNLANKYGPKPDTTLSTLKQHGVYPGVFKADNEVNCKSSSNSNNSMIKNLNNDSKLAFICLGDNDNKEYWLGSSNLYAITRYNHSVNYAMAVYQLSQEILHAVKKQ